AFVVDGMTGAATGTATSGMHGFGANTVLEDGSVAVTGGMADLNGSPEGAITFFSGKIDALGQAELAPSAPLLSPRALHQTAALRGRGLLTTGGVRLKINAVELVPETEVFFLAR